MKKMPPTCFVAGTLILTAAGLGAIETIKAGDKVIATNQDTSETEEKTVVESVARKTSNVLHITINKEEIIKTPEHPFYGKDKGFVNAGRLYVGDEFVTVEGGSAAKYQVGACQDIKGVEGLDAHHAGKKAVIKK